MKIRVPKKTDWDEPGDLNVNQYSKIYQVKTITPIYGGGVEAGMIDKTMPIRAAAIRGQLRYWWRFLQANREDGQQLTGEALYRAERAIWGGMNTPDDNNGEKDRDAASKVRINIVMSRNTGGRNPISADQAATTPGTKYALFPAVQNESQLLAEGVCFELHLQALKKSPDSRSNVGERGLTQQQWEEVLRAVRWWANFGGIGARTRRGLGAVEVEGVNLLTADEVKAYGCKLKLQQLQTNNPISAWNSAVEKLFQFRQKRGTGRAQGNGPDTLRDITGMHGHPVEHKAIRSFPRALFGLPIIFEIRGGGEPLKAQLLPVRDASSRMASPLIIKPIADGAGGYRPCVLRLPTNHLNNLKVKLEEVGNDSRGTYKRVTDQPCWPASVDEQTAKADAIRPMQGRSHDPLQAFLKFFAE